MSKEEIEQIRDRCICIVLPLSKFREFEKGRGYEDLSPECAWEQWQEVREAMHAAIDSAPDDREGA